MPEYIQTTRAALNTDLAVVFEISTNKTSYTLLKWSLVPVTCVSHPMYVCMYAWSHMISYMGRESPRSVIVWIGINNKPTLIYINCPNDEYAKPSVTAGGSSTRSIAIMCANDWLHLIHIHLFEYDTVIITQTYLKTLSR